MENKKTKIIKIVITAIWVCLLCGILLYGSCKSDLTPEDQKAIKDLETILVKKHEKQNCLNNLSYLESIENARGILHCNWNDEENKEKRENILNHITWEEYENVDLKIAEKLSNDTWTTSLEKLSFLLSE